MHGNAFAQESRCQGQNAPGINITMPSCFMLLKSQDAVICLEGHHQYGEDADITKK